jgi:2-phospho-L-lactate guanylyltransferase
MAELGVPVSPDPLGGGGLNAALRLGFLLLRHRDPNSVIGALQSDLPALGAGNELDTAINAAAGERAFCADHLGTGTTLLLSAAGAPLDPRFGEGSAAAHAESGAIPLSGELPRLRCDVDTAEDLEIAVGLGAGQRTIGALRRQAS